MFTLLLIVANVAISLYALYQDQSLLDRFMLRPYREDRKREYYTLITSAFLHADPAHLAFNMITLYFFGTAVERQVGPILFGVIYLLSVLSGSVVSQLKYKDDPNYATLGASGGVSGVLFAAVLFFPGMSLYMFPIPFAIPGPIYAVLYIGYTYYASRSRNDGINHDAHLFGALAGLACALWIAPESFSAFISYFLKLL
ncbi:rhomboid family intramembrane serine protease [Leptospira perolatii]|uniref:Rhomboid family intramembrane serine protease n=1 Tax=Leptospira perolatii TaxID=2023191 RepID=A0A2M9ZT01_9LEPT|nr:rhomboid family intramembrane serine protease [Leptospira perolatii]PJZ68746.1 rhomboid family intramembrane serine protease [Leptospira perolatii]PJZ75101.1 rhomboid family intramembrane serine protease [Leptospira perolatii]